MTADVDVVLGNAITAPVAIGELRRVGGSVKYPDRVVLVLDHFVPAKDIKSAEQCKIVRDFARVAGEYFELDGGITFSMREEKGASCVSISFRATRVKNFTTLP